MMLTMVVMAWRAPRPFNCRSLIVLFALESIYLLEKKGASADPVNVTQCVPQTNNGGVSFGCPGGDFMIWTRVAFCGMTPSKTSPSPAFCENPTPDSGGRGDCVADPSGDRRAAVENCNTYSNCQVVVKPYNDIVDRCPATNGFPYTYINYECLPRKKSDGVTFIDIVIPGDSGTNPSLVGKMYLFPQGYPFRLTNKNMQCQISVGANTRVTFRLLDIFGRLLDASGSCPFTLYMYSGTSGTYREWCVARNWTVDYSAPVVFAATPSPQNIDVIFSKTYPGKDAEGALWLFIDAVNAADNSAASITASFGTSFTPQARPTTTTTTTTTTTPTTVTSTTTTTTTTTPTTTTTTPTTTTTTPTTITTTTTPTSSSLTTTTTTPSTTTTTSTIAPSTTTSSTTTQSTIAGVIITTASSLSSQSNWTSMGAPSSTVGEKTTQGNETNPFSGQKNASNTPTNVIIGVVVAAAAVALIVIVVASVAVYCSRKHRRSSNGKKPHPSSSDSVDTKKDLGKVSAEQVFRVSRPAFSSISGGNHFYEEIPDETTDSQIAIALPHGLSSSPTLGTTTILRSATAKAQPRTTTGRVRFVGETDWDSTAAAAAATADEGGFYQGGSNISDDDKMMRQTATIAGDIHPRGINRSNGKGKDRTLPGKKAIDSGVQMNPVYGIRPNEIYMY